MKVVNRVFLVVFASICILVAQMGCESQKPMVQEPRTAAAKEPVTTEQGDVNGTAVISFEKTVYNFGEIVPGSRDNLWEFKFKNTGSGVLKITRVKKTCGCTPYSLAKKEYAPGESGVLKGEYHASAHKGAISKNIYVFSNDENTPKVGLAIRGKIAPKIEHKPEKIELSLGLDNAGCPEIVLNSTDGKEFSIKEFTSTNRNCITADFDPNVKATEFVLQPKVDVEKLRAKTRGTLQIKLTHPKAKLITISYTVLAEYVVLPKSIIVRKAVPDEPVNKQIVIKNSYNRPFNVESTSSKNGYVKVINQSEQDNSYRFQLEIIPPPLTARGLYFRDLFSVNIVNGPKLDIAIVGYYAKDAGKAK